MAENINLELSSQTTSSWLMKKILVGSDVDQKNNRLRLPKREFEEFVIPEMEWGLVENLEKSVEVIVKDVKGTDYHVTLVKYQNGSYNFVDKWNDIVKAKGLKEGDQITLMWDKDAEIFYIM
ncbi:unnamed protein product [Eruca vesicaria subsp. sativa]|uniref:TF-B3 domain-containing protein n=1 Tax=Eruca vesicaria subsp. sativa TaxID=29727 RepID=A0ABC8M4A3_ERUVS|nr:unnamed protein product [Eruca vesicaria subsp. sativa]